MLDRLRGAREAAERLTFQKRALERTRARLAPDKSLIGFIGGPWTLFVYAVEGRHQGNQRAAKAAVRLFQPFCEPLVAWLVENVRMQLEGGTEIVMMLCLPVNQFRSELHGYLEPLVRLAPERRRGWVCGTGHGVPPDASEANVHAFVQTVREVFA